MLAPSDLALFAVRPGDSVKENCRGTGATAGGDPNSAHSNRLELLLVCHRFDQAVQKLAVLALVASLRSRCHIAELTHPSQYPSDGGSPNAGLVQGSDGNFYGTTAYGGTNNLDTVFKLTVPLNSPPYPINQITGVQITTPNIIFSIPSIAGETYQLQFSSSMNPTNWVNVPVSVTNSIGALLTLTNFGGASQPQGFYRFDITP